jgi:multicomponent Na+:H+ antiporter subunit G
VTLAWIADLLVVIGVVVTTLAVIGVYRLPDVYLKVHAAGKVASFAIVALALATVATRDGDTIVRALLITAFLVLTAPVSAHAIARAAATRGEPMAGEDSIDESDWGLARSGGQRDTAAQDPAAADGQ